MEYTGIVTKLKEDSNNNTLSVDSYQVSSSSVPQQQMVEAPQTIGRVHCVCVKRSNGQFCLAKLQQASPSAKRHPNAMYWSCSKRTVSGIRLNVQNILFITSQLTSFSVSDQASSCKFFRLASSEELEFYDTRNDTTLPHQLLPSSSMVESSIDTTNIVCSRCKQMGHYARSCPNMSTAPNSPPCKRLRK